MQEEKDQLKKILLKLNDQRSFTIKCEISHTVIPNVSLDSGASVNVILLFMVIKMGLLSGVDRSKNVKLLANKSAIKPFRELTDIVEKVG